MYKLFLLPIAFVLVFMGPIAFAQTEPAENSRLQELSYKYSVKLSDDQKTLIATSCDSTKNNIKALQRAADSAVRKRLVVYTDIQKELKAIETRLGRQGADASELDLLIGKIQQNLDSFSAASRVHNEITQDLLAVDCKNNPELFAAGIYELKASREELLNTSQSLKQTISNSRQSTFEPLLKRLVI